MAEAHKYNTRLKKNGNSDTVIPVDIHVSDEQFIQNMLSSDIAGEISDNSDSQSELDCSGVYDYDSGDDSQPFQCGQGDSVSTDNPDDVQPGSSKTEKVARRDTVDVQAVINSKILQQLETIGKRLDKIEGEKCKKTVDKAKIKNSGKVAKKKTGKTQPTTTPAPDMPLPSVDSMRQDVILQAKVEQRLQELAMLAKAGTENSQKLKSQRGGNVEVLVQKRVKWPHEFVLAGVNKERVTYDQLSATQWMAGFARTMKEEKNLESRQHMLDYLIAIMDDANDFSWSSAKASHAVLLCRMEQGEVSDYSDTVAIDRIRRANAQKVLPSGHMATNANQNFQNQKRFSKVNKSMPCMYFNQGSCVQAKSHETRGVLYKHVCSTCFAGAGKSFPHAEIDCKNKNKYAKND